MMCRLTLYLSIGKTNIKMFNVNTRLRAPRSWLTCQWLLGKYLQRSTLALSSLTLLQPHCSFKDPPTLVSLALGLLHTWRKGQVEMNAPSFQSCTSCSIRPSFIRFELPDTRLPYPASWRTVHSFYLSHQTFQTLRIPSHILVPSIYVDQIHLQRNPSKVSYAEKFSLPCLLAMY